MNKPLFYSRLLQFSILLSFLLPFYLVGCTELKSEESASNMDTTAATVDSMNLLAEDSISQVLNQSDTTTVSTQDSALVKEEKELSISEELSQEHRWLSAVLVPEKDVFTGAALVLDVGSEIISFNIVIAWILLFLCLIIKLMESHAVRTQVLHNLLASVALYVYSPPGFWAQRLWGFTVCFSLLLITIACDIYRLILLKRLKKLQ